MGAVYTWTEEKNRANKKKHGFYISDILEVFDDPHLLEFYDADHSTPEEERYITIGRFHNTTILFVVTTDRKGGETQIISARKATQKEQEAYNDHYRKSAYSSGN